MRARKTCEANQFGRVYQQYGDFDTSGLKRTSGLDTSAFNASDNRMQRMLRFFPSEVSEFPREVSQFPRSRFYRGRIYRCRFYRGR